MLLYTELVWATLYLLLYEEIPESATLRATEHAEEKKQKKKKKSLHGQIYDVYCYCHLFVYVTVVSVLFADENLQFSQMG